MGGGAGGRIRIDATIDGRPVQREVDGDLTLVHLLREELRLTGTKIVCGGGVCGACTVLVNGAPVASCLLPASAIDGATVQTVQGLPSELHPVQRAFAAHDALQCGFCTPGFVMQSVAFHDRWRRDHPGAAPSRQEVTAALAGHLCRCGSYASIVSAVIAACAGEFDAPDLATPVRVDAVAKVTGRAAYTVDVALPDMLHGALARSPVAHGHLMTPVSSLAHPETALAVVDLAPPDGVLRYAGQPFAAVAASTRAAAYAAAAALTRSARIQPLPAVLDPDTASSPDAPVLFQGTARRHARNASEGPLAPAVPWRGNLRGPTLAMTWRGGTARRRIAAAAEGNDPRLVQAVFTTAVQVHTALEPHACLARWDGDGRGVELWVSTQAVTGLAGKVAKRWKVPRARVRVHAEYVGGGFGSKLGMGLETVAAVELARAAGRPVRVAFDRAEELLDTGCRPGSRTEIAMLAGRRGELRALTIETRGLGGISIGTLVASLGRFVYGLAPRALRDWDVLTNEPPGLPFRGPGGPPFCWAMEQAVDEMAHRLDVDPIALRMQWDGNRKRRMLYEWAAALPVWRDRPRAGEERGRFRRGVGVAAGNWFYFVDGDTVVSLDVRDGRIVATSAVQDMGTGSRSVIAAAVAAHFGLAPGDVDVDIGSTAAPHGPTSGASRTTTSVGPAATAAAANLARIIAARLDGRAIPQGVERAGRVVPWRDALPEASGASASGRRPRDRRGYLFPVFFDHLHVGRGMSGAVHVTEVEVDTRLGRTRVRRVWAGIAAGRIWVPRLARSQAEGAIVQGIGFALYEQRRSDPVTGRVLTTNLEDYRTAGIADTPEMEVHFHEAGWDHVPGGGIGLGEVATVAVAASVGNAIHNATGWRPRDLPVRPDRMLAGLGA